jgi:hypothetical protein
MLPTTRNSLNPRRMGTISEAGFKACVFAKSEEFEDTIMVWK